MQFARSLVILLKSMVQLGPSDFGKILSFEKRWQSHDIYLALCRPAKRCLCKWVKESGLHLAVTGAGAPPESTPAEARCHQ